MFLVRALLLLLLLASADSAAYAAGASLGTDGDRNGLWDDLQQHLSQYPAGEVAQSLHQVARAMQQFAALGADGGAAETIFEHAVKVIRAMECAFYVNRHDAAPRLQALNEVYNANVARTEAYARVGQIAQEHPASQDVATSHPATWWQSCTERPVVLADWPRE